MMLVTFYGLEFLYLDIDSFTCSCPVCHSLEPFQIQANCIATSNKKYSVNVTPTFEHNLTFMHTYKKEYTQLDGFGKY